MLEIDGLQVAYGPVQAVRGATLRVDTGEVVGLIGANGAGKTSTLNAVLGLVAASGQITLDGRELARLSTPSRIRAGLALVPQGRQLFGGLSVAENLRAGGWLQPDAEQVAVSGLPEIPRLARLGRMGSVGRRRAQSEPLELLRDFPELHGRLGQAAGTLSGGEQQMVAIARAMASRPSCLLLDEPSMGLSPIVIDRVAAALAELVRERELTVLLVDQGVGLVARLAQRCYVMVHGEIADELDAAALTSRAVERKYFG